MKLGGMNKYAKLLAAAGGGAIVGAGASTLFKQIPMIGSFGGGLVGLLVGLATANIAGKKIGGNGMAGMVGYAITSGALSGVFGTTTGTAVASRGF